jgi:tetratricopeptide (TPR) repeat protein
MICPNCEAENSIYAAECYHCGFPLGGKPKKKKHGLVVLAVFVVLTGILLLGSPLILKKTDEWVVKGKRSYFTFVAEQNFSINKFPEAVAYYSKAIKLGGASARLFAKRGSAYYQLGEYDNALEDFTHAIEGAPQNGKYYLYRGKTYLMLKRKSAAREDLSAAAKVGIMEAQALLMEIADNHGE